MTDRKLLGLALTVCLVLSVVSGGGTVALLSDSETVTAELDVDVPDAGNAPPQEDSQVTRTGNVPAAAGNVPPEGGQGDAGGGPSGQVDGPDRAARSARQ